MFSKLDKVFRLAAKRYATSFKLWLATSPFFVAGLVFTELSDNWVSASVLPVLLSGLVSHLVLGAILWVGSKTVLSQERRDSAGWRQVLGVFILAGMARGFTIGFLIEAYEVGPASYVTRINTSVVLVVFSFTFVAYSAQLWRDYRERRLELLTSIALGERTDALRGVASAEYRPLALGDLEQDVIRAREETMLALLSIREKVHADQVDPALIQDVFDDSDNNWRKLSHKAWIASLPNVPKIDIAEFTKTLAGSKPISLIALSAGPAYGFTRIFNELPISIAIVAAFVWWLGVVVLAVATNAFANRFRKLGVVLLLAGFSAIQLFAFFNGLLFLSDTRGQEIWFVSLVSSSAALALGLPPALERGGQLVLEQLERRLDNSALENLKAQGEMFVLAQRIGGYLHSEVRGDFLRYSLSLKDALEEGDTAEADKVLDQLETLVSAIDLEKSERSPIETLLTFLSNWNGVINVSHNLGEVEISSQLEQSVEVIVMEAVNNAVRHGQATWVSVSVLKGSDSLDLQIESDSKPLTENSAQGLGTKTLDRLAPNRWTVQAFNSREHEPALRLQVSLPIQKVKS